MKKLLMLICAVGLLISGCNDKEKLPVLQTPPPPVQNTTPIAKKYISITVNGKSFKATLEDKRTARAFAQILPLEVDMIELNVNEKYFYLDNDLPTDSVRVQQIRAGDLMLYESNCVVLFYNDFRTNESYTRLGKIENPEGLAELLGNGNVHIKFAE